MVNFLQINLNGFWATKQLITQTTVEKNADVLIISELYTQYGREDSWRFSLEQKTAVATTQQSSLTHDGQGSSTRFA